MRGSGWGARHGVAGDEHEGAVPVLVRQGRLEELSLCAEQRERGIGGLDRRHDAAARQPRRAAAVCSVQKHGEALSLGGGGEPRRPSCSLHDVPVGEEAQRHGFAGARSWAAAHRRPAGEAERLQRPPEERRGRCAQEAQR